MTYEVMGFSLPLMSYISKSIKGKIIISNLDVEESVHFNTDIQTELGSTFDIGSSDKPFRALYIDEV